MKPLDEKPANGTTVRPGQNNSCEIIEDARLVKIVQEYLEALEAGRSPNRDEFLRREPDIADALARCLDGLELIHRAEAGRAWRASPEQPASVDAIGGFPLSPLGDFQIVREVGRGGMGVVYEAVQLSLGRRVALKVLPLAAAYDAKDLQRFRNEAQAAAQLHHTNIVPVHAVGCERGLHFYAMQFIDGQTLAAILEQVRGSRTHSQPKLTDTRSWASPISAASTVAEREGTEPVSMLSTALSEHRSRNAREFYHAIARLIIQAADGLEHAHLNAIVHRDVKPANLLVDATGRVWITDFGLAQFHAELCLTRTGDVVGTLRYMSPEQASGQRMLLDHRTDIYSLGATLYELATLEPMFGGNNREKLLHQILHEEPKPPSLVERSVPIELETIILKAVSKAPPERYGSAKEFALDLQRYVEDKPILAKRPGIVARVRKWSRRHPSFVIASIVLLFFGAIGFATTTLIVGNAYSRERKRTMEAEQRFKQARRCADEMIRIAQEELADHPPMQEVRRRLLETALTYYQEFIEQRSEDPEAQAELAITRDQVKRILADLAVLQGAGRHFLLKEPAVLDDLGVDAGQREKLQGFFLQLDSQHREFFSKFGQLVPEDRQKRFLDIVRANELLMASILNPEQIKRLQQITLQCQGAMAFRDPEVMAKLQLTGEQKSRIRAPETGMFAGGPVPPWSNPKMRAANRTALMKQILEILSDSQTRQWETLIGRPFAAADQVFLPGPPPGNFGPPFPSKVFEPNRK